MIRADMLRASMRDTWARMMVGMPGKSASPVNAQVTTPAHPVAPYPSNATEVPPHPYGVSDNPGLGVVGPPGIIRTTTGMLPPVYGTIPAYPGLASDVGLQTGIPPMRVPRLYPTREAAGLRFSQSDTSMGTPNGDLQYVPLPQIPKTTAIPTRVRGGYPQSADTMTIPGVYVGGDSAHA